ncbi:MAG: hypothetical protein OEZ29_01250 [Candidatus Bathyarchaeota archaeon]|nr:hypothetical protein [Candidatus Bathyarchaeota archaeon]
MSSDSGKGKAEFKTVDITNEECEKLVELMDGFIEAFQRIDRKGKFHVPRGLYGEYAVYLVCLDLFKMGLNPKLMGGGIADIWLPSLRKKVEVKRSGYQSRRRNEPKERHWVWGNIHPEKIDYLVLIGAGKDNKQPSNYFIFTKQEAEEFIPLVDWGYNMPDHAKYTGRCLEIYDKGPRRSFREIKWKVLKKKKHIETEFIPKEERIHENLQGFQNRWDKITG